MKNPKHFKLTTPVLFLIFNRLETTKKVFGEIRKAKPTKLYIAADGPRNEEEKKKTDAVRKYVLSHIDWPCKVKTLFREKNLGCRIASNKAISWVLNLEDRCMVLEDDTIPSKTYFRFMQEILEYYKNNEKIMSVGGVNFLKRVNISESYFFSKVHTSGTGIWRRSWQKQDLDVKRYLEIEKSNELYKYIPNIIERVLWKKRVKDMLSRKVDSWGYAFQIAHFINRGLCVIPKVNLIKNIGFDEEATHTRFNKIDKKYISLPKFELKFPLVHPKKIEINKELEKKLLILEIKRILLKRL
ncbi:MAG: hypothetical protein QXX68_01520 [Candidatus Pacearchaeota archaeon]